MFTIIILSGVEHGSKVLRRQVVEILGPTQFLRFPSRDSTLKIKITRLLIGLGNKRGHKNVLKYHIKWKRVWFFLFLVIYNE